MFVFKDDFHAGTKHFKHFQKLQTTTVQNKHKQIATRYHGTKCPENKLPNKCKHTLSENCSRLQSPCRHHFGNWQGYCAALGDDPSQLREHHIAHGWRLELYIRATLLSVFCHSFV